MFELAFVMHSGIGRPEHPDIFRQRMAYLCGLGLGDMALDGGEYGLDRPLRIDRPAAAFEAVRDAGDELRVRTHRVRLNGRAILLVKRSTNQQGELGSP